MRLLPFVLALAMPLAAAAQDRAPAPRPAGPAVRVSTHVDRTAVWVGDIVNYVVEFRAAPNVEILTDDLNADRLTIEGLEVLDVSTERDESLADTVIHRVRYRLVTYQVENPELTIAAAPVRFAIREPGQRPEDAAPAGELTVPALTLGLRSTLPASDAEIELRDDRTVRPLPWLVRVARPLGLILILLSVVPAFVWGAEFVRRAGRAWASRPKRPPMRQRRATLESIRTLPVLSIPERREAYAQLDAWVRDQLQATTGVTASALTPDEFAGAVTRTPKSMHLPDVQRLLAECEQAKYAPEPPPSDHWPAAVDQAETLLAGRAR